MENLNKTDIGLIGLAVMGENLALNMADKGWRVSVYNRTVPGIEEGVVERFINGRAQGKSIEGYTDIARFVESVAVPRKIMMMVRAGSAVDELMEQLRRLRYISYWRCCSVLQGRWPNIRQLRGSI
jgi:6-phosphogluconate dehydrogenase